MQSAADRKTADNKGDALKDIVRRYENERDPYPEQIVDFYVYESEFDNRLRSQCTIENTA